jgi:hypothetical protein
MGLPGRGANFDVTGKTFKKGGVKVAFQVLKSKKLNNLKRFYGRQYHRALNEAMNKEMESILKRARADTPVDTGRLRKSGRILKPAGRGRVVAQWEIRFGGIRVHSSKDGRGNRLVDYASIIHERGGKAGNGKANFLIDNWNAALLTITNKIDRQLRKRLPRFI